MIGIRAELCTGCGACMQACPTGAIFLVEGKAMIDESLCRECEACVPACPSGAIAFAMQEAKAVKATGLPALQPEPQVIRVDAPSVLATRRFRLLPALGAALAWAGREILPSLLDLLDRRTTRLQAGGATRNRLASTSATSSGRKHRRRQRGGGS